LFKCLDNVLLDGKNNIFQSFEVNSVAIGRVFLINGLLSLSIDFSYIFCLMNLLGKRDIVPNTFFSPFSRFECSSTTFFRLSFKCLNHHFKFNILCLSCFNQSLTLQGTFLCLHDYRFVHSTAQTKSGSKFFSVLLNIIDISHKRFNSFVVHVEILKKLSSICSSLFAARYYELVVC